MAVYDQRFSSFWICVILVGIAAVSAAAFFRSVTDAASLSSSLTIGNGTSSITAIVVNNGNPITLTANTTTTVTVSFTVSDGNGCTDVFSGGNVTTTLFRFGAGASCVEDSLNCYIVSTTTHNCASATSSSANATATFQLYYFAQATDASSSFSAEDWAAGIQVRDVLNGTSSATSTGVELNTLTAIELATSSIAYGSLIAGTNTTSTNQISTIQNAGNSSTSLQVSGNALTSGANSIPTSSQHYATSTFTYGGVEQQLQSTAQTVGGLAIPRPMLTSWSTTLSFPSSTAYHGFVANNGYLYKSGGYNSIVATSSVLFAPINATGSIGTWSATTPLAGPLYFHGSLVYNNFVYALGGQVAAGSTRTSTVLFAPINATGSIGSWATTTSLVASTTAHAVASHSGFVYIAGGSTAGGVTSTVQFAPINATGSIGTWTNTTALPGARYVHSLLAHNGFMYAVGGQDSAGNPTSTVQFAPINATGSIGTWTNTTALPGALGYVSSLVNNGAIYVMAGFTGANATSSVYFAPIRPSGFIGPWSTAPSLPSSTYGQSATAYNGFVYVSAGNTDSGNPTSTVRFASLASRNLFWGASVPGGQAMGNYTSTLTYTAVFAP